MAFSNTIEGYGHIGNKKKTWGTYTNGAGDTGGNLDTGLGIVEQISLTSTAAAVIAAAAVINETLPMPGSAITIVNTAGEDGHWEAWGHG